MFGFLIGLVFGGVALLCMVKAVNKITSGKYEGVFLPILGNALSILLGLVITALFLRNQILYSGIGLSVAIIGGAIAIFIIRSGKLRDDGNNK